MESRNFQNLLSWLKDNGAHFEGIEVPVKFESGEVGVKATRYIASRTAIMSIPSRTIISVNKCLRSELKELFETYEHIFSLQKVSDAEFNVLAFYVFHELLKGQKSFYFPFFNCLPHKDFTMIEWSEDELNSLNSNYLKGSEMDRVYTQIKLEVIDKSPEYRQFSQKQLKQTFFRAYYLVMTRCYGWQIPSTSLIPLADMCNHSDRENSTHYVVHKRHQLNPKEKPEPYKIKQNRIDLSLIGIKPNEKPCFKSKKYQYVEKYVKQHHKEDIKLIPDIDQAVLSEMIKAIEQEQIAKAKSFTDILLYYTDDDQDNDTDEEQKDKRKAVMVDLKCREVMINKKRKEKKKVDMQEEGFYPNTHEPEPQPVPQPQSSQSSEDETEWDWLTQEDQDWSFVVTSKQAIQPNEQIYNNYGQRTNRFLFMWYGFCPTTNKYDSFAFRILLDSMQKYPLHELPDHMIFTGWINQQLHGKQELTEELKSQHLSKEFRIKLSEVCLDFIRFLRMFLLRFHKEQEIINCFQIPISVDYEIYVFQFYYLILVHILEKNFKKIEKSTSQHASFINSFIESQHRIVHQQRNIVRECLNILVSLKKGRHISEFIHVLPEMRPILGYLRELTQYL